MSYISTYTGAQIDTRLSVSHTQGTDAALDIGGENEISAIELTTLKDTTVPAKADKVSGAITDGEIAGLDENGNLKSLGEPSDTFNVDFGTTSGTIAEGNHNHDSDYEPVIAKNNAFNKSFGTGALDVATGNHTHTDLHTHDNKAVLDTITSLSGTIEILTTFSYDDATPMTLFTCPAGKAVFSVNIAISEVFNGTGATLKVGDAGSNDRLMTTSKNNPAVAESYVSTPAHIYSSETAVQMWIVPGAGASTGKGIVVVKRQV